MLANYGRKVGWIGWCLIPICLVASAISMTVGDMLFICLEYGQRAYFAEGLRIIKHKPYTLSTGVVLSNNLSTLAFLLDTVIWLGLTFGMVGALVAISGWLRRLRPCAAPKPS